MTWTVPTPSPVDGPMTRDDRPILEGYLNYQRSTLLNICAGLTGEQLARRPLSSSNLSLLGLIRHLAKVERIWFRQRAAGLGFDDTLDAGGGDTFSVRMVYVHLIGEYARHNGHADLLREALDGVTGR
jgi:Protein of unknown function (DUF664)